MPRGTHPLSKVLSICERNAARDRLNLVGGQEAKALYVLRCQHLREMTSHCERRRIQISNQNETSIAKNIPVLASTQGHFLVLIASNPHSPLPSNSKSPSHPVYFQTSPSMLNTNRPQRFAFAPWPHQCKLRTDRLSAPRRGADKDIVVRSIQSLKHLSLDFVENLYRFRVNRLKLLDVQRRARKCL